MISPAKNGLLAAALLLCLFSLPLHGESSSILSGPLYSKNFYLPHLPVYSFPGFSPRSGRRGDRYLTFAYTGVNEFVAYDEKTLALDYESSLLEAGYRFRPSDRIILGADVRLISYYGGFMDGFIESFHSLFGFPNAGRNLFERNRLFVDLDNRTGRDLSLETPLVAPGDTDLSCVWTFREENRLSLALAGALKLPTGSPDWLTGSGYADLGVQILGEYRFNDHWSLNGQEGIVFPGDWMLGCVLGVESYAEKPLSQTYLSLNYSPRNDWVLTVQSRVNTSPISSDRERVYVSLGTITLFTLPQTSFQMGMRKSFGDWVFQVQFEEDPLTYEGADILVSARLTRSF